MNLSCPYNSRPAGMILATLAVTIVLAASTQTLAAEEQQVPAKATASLTHHDVIPILLRRCTVCHGARKQEAGLDLRTRDSLIRGGKSGPALVPGKPDESLIIQKIRSGQMPPLRRVVEVSVKPIEPAETERIAQWITQGALEAAIAPDVAGVEPDTRVTDEDRRFWSFRSPQPVRVPVPPAADRTAERSTGAASGDG